METVKLEIKTQRLSSLSSGSRQLLTGTNDGTPNGNVIRGNLTPCLTESNVIRAKHREHHRRILNQLESSARPTGEGWCDQLFDRRSTYACVAGVPFSVDERQIEEVMHVVHRNAR
jgi:hypothetical protein